MTSSIALDTAKRAQLLEKGFVVFPDLLPPAFLGRLRAVTDALLDARTEAEREQLKAQGSLILTNSDPIFADLIAFPPALECLQQLGFSSATFSDGYVISKAPLGPRLFWHYDWFAWDDDRSYQNPPPQLFLMYYLSDTSRENGCLRAIPRSHIEENPLHALLAEPHSERLSKMENAHEQVEFSDRPDEVDVPVRAGDLLVGDARLLHAAHDNQTNERRTLITLWFQPDFDQLPEPIQAQVVAKTHAVPADWPQDAKDKMRAVTPTYTGAHPPLARSLWRPRYSR